MKLDLLKGHWQISLTPHASEISAFVTPDSFLQYTVMPFGLRNAPATFQRLMHQVLGGVNDCEVYLDDTAAYSRTWPKHIETLKTIFGRSSLTLNLAKYESGRTTLTYLGKQVSQGQVRALGDSPGHLGFPCARSLLRMAGYCCGFCKNFSSVVAPSTNLTSASRPFEWSPSCTKAFQSAKAVLCSTPVPTAANFACPFKLEVDVSASGVGGLLLQEDDHGIDHPICCFSKKFSRPVSGCSVLFVLLKY